MTGKSGVGYVQKVASAFACLALVVFAQQRNSESVAVEENVLYTTVEGTPLHLDVYKPAGTGAALHPAVILIHGGGWTSLDKSTMAGMGHFLARHGYIAFAVDYRLFDGHRNRWPAQLHDVQRAVI